MAPVLRPRRFTAENPARHNRRAAETHNDGQCKDAAERIKGAYNRALNEGAKTRDLGGDLETETFASAVIERLSSPE